VPTGVKTICNAVLLVSRHRGHALLDVLPPNVARKLVRIDEVFRGNVTWVVSYCGPTAMAGELAAGLSARPRSPSS